MATLKIKEGASVLGAELTESVAASPLESDVYNSFIIPMDLHGIDTFVSPAMYLSMVQVNYELYYEPSLNVKSSLVCKDWFLPVSAFLLALTFIYSLLRAPCISGRKKKRAGSQISAHFPLFSSL